MFKYAKLYIATAAIVFASSSNASWISAGQLNDMFFGGEYERGAATGFVAAIAATADGTVACIPNNVTIGDIKEVVAITLQEIPQHFHRSADVVTAVILRSAWPCFNRAGSI